MSMKVLVSPAHFTLMKEYGSEILWSYELLKHLSLNCDIYAIFNCQCLEKSDIIFNRMKIFTFLNERIIHPTLFQTIIYIYKYFMLSRWLIKTEEFDLIHHMLPFGYCRTFNLLPLLGYTERTPFVVGPLQSPLRFKENLSKNLILKGGDSILFYLCKKTLEKADVLICINEDSKKLYSKIVDKNKPIFVIPPGIDIGRFDYGVRKEKDNIEIICVAYLQRRKGFDLIIKAISEVIKERQNIILKIVGIGPESKKLIQLSNQLNLKKYINFEGFVPNMGISKYYQNADIFVSMSYAESFGQTLIEAMATGLPVIATKIEGFKEIVVHGETGFLIDHDVDELRKHLIKLIDNKELRNKMGQKARKIVEEKYDWKIIAEKYYEIYHNLVNNKSGV